MVYRPDYWSSRLRYMTAVLHTLAAVGSRATYIKCVKVVTVWVENRLHLTAKVLSIALLIARNLLMKTVEVDTESEMAECLSSSSSSIFVDIRFSVPEKSGLFFTTNFRSKS